MEPILDEAAKASTFPLIPRSVDCVTSKVAVRGKACDTCTRYRPTDEEVSNTFGDLFAEFVPVIENTCQSAMNNHVKRGLGSHPFWKCDFVRFLDLPGL